MVMANLSTAVVYLQGTIGFTLWVILFIANGEEVDLASHAVHHKSILGPSLSWRKVIKYVSCKSIVLEALEH